MQATRTPAGRPYSSRLRKHRPWSTVHFWTEGALRSPDPRAELQEASLSPGRALPGLISSRELLRCWARGAIAGALVRRAGVRGTEAGPVADSGERGWETSWCSSCDCGTKRVGVVGEGPPSGPLLIPAAGPRKQNLRLSLCPVCLCLSITMATAAEVPLLPLPARALGGAAAPP